MVKLRDDFRQTRIVFRLQPLLNLSIALIQTQHIVVGNLTTVAIARQTARGAVTRAMRSPALRAWQSAPDPKICISYGACGNSGGIFHDLYCVWGGTDKIVPVDVYIPGCPPTPAATLYGFAMALGLLEQKIHARGPGEQDEQPADILHPDMVQPLRVKVDREARRLAGYRYGRQIADDFLTQLGQGEEQVARWLEAENDPRLNEIVSHLNHVVEEARIR